MANLTIRGTDDAIRGLDALREQYSPERISRILTEELYAANEVEAPDNTGELKGSFFAGPDRAGYTAPHAPIVNARGRHRGFVGRVIARALRRTVDRLRAPTA